jgi:hypothetical protein
LSVSLSTSPTPLFQVVALSQSTEDGQNIGMGTESLPADKQLKQLQRDIDQLQVRHCSVVRAMTIETLLKSQLNCKDPVETLLNLLSCRAACCASATPTPRCPTTSSPSCPPPSA